MALVINTAPGAYYSVHGDLIFVVYDSVNVTEPDFKYVADIYIGATLVARIKKYPQPDNDRGVFNLGQIIRAYVSAIFSPVSGALVSQELALEKFFIEATVKFGEEYDFTLYTNITVDSERRYFNHYNGLLVGQNTVLTPYLDKVASGRPYQTAVSLADSFTLIPYFPSDTDPVDVVFSKYGTSGGTPVTIAWGYTTGDPTPNPEAVSLQFSGSYVAGLNTLTLNFTSSGDSKYLVLKEPISQPIKTDWINTAFNYGTFPDSVFREYVEVSGYRYYYSRIPVVLDSTNYSIAFTNNLPDTPGSTVVTATFTATFTPSEAEALQVLNISPGLVNALSPGFIDAYTDYYTAMIGSQTYRMDIACDPRFELYTLHFMNRFGGFETRNFNKVSKKNLSITKIDYGRLPYTVDSNGAVVYYNDNGVYNETRATYASQWKEKITLNTDLLSDEEYAWLADLVISPLVYVQQGAFFIPVNITANNYDFRTHQVDKMTNLTLDIEFGNQLNAQFR